MLTIENLKKVKVSDIDDIMDEACELFNDHDLYCVTIKFVINKTFLTDEDFNVINEYFKSHFICKDLKLNRRMLSHHDQLEDYLILTINVYSSNSTYSLNVNDFIKLTDDDLKDNYELIVVEVLPDQLTKYLREYFVFSNFKVDQNVEYCSDIQYYIDRILKEKEYLKSTNRIEHIGSPLEFAFDFDSEKDSEFIYFNSNNWNDPLINDIRSVIEEMVYDDKKFDKVELYGYMLKNDQSTAILTYIEDDEVHDLYITWYKSRGRTELILQHDLTNATLNQLITLHKLIYNS